MARKSWACSAAQLMIGTAACSPEQGSAPSRSSQSQSGASNSAIAETPPPADLRGQYDEWVAIATEDVEANFGFFNHVMANERGELHFEAAECSPQETAGDIDGPGPDPSHEERLEDNLRTLAHQMVRHRISLARGGYPEQIWAEPLRRYEEARLDEIRRFPALNIGNIERSPEQEQALDFFRVMDGIDASRASVAPDSPPVMRTFECGGDVIAIWRAIPPGGRVWLIDTMDFGYCRRRFGDAYDLDRCTRWEEVGPDQVLQVGGIYASQARWPDGRRGTARHTIIDDHRLASPRILHVRPGVAGP